MNNVYLNIVQRIVRYIQVGDVIHERKFEFTFQPIN